MILQLQEDNDEKAKIISSLKLELNRVNALLQQKRKIIAELRYANLENDREVYYDRKIK
jgi:hypothetical protein